MEMQERIKKAIRDYMEARGYPPTVRDIAFIVGLKSTSSVQRYIKSLIESGELETDEDPCSSRAVRVPGMKWIDTRKYTAVVKQLEALRCHCLEMAREPGSAGDWGRDAEALRYAIEALRGEAVPGGKTDPSP